MKYTPSALAVGLLLLLVAGRLPAQEPMLDFPVDSLIRLTGLLEMGKKPQASAYPRLAVWIDEGPTGLFQVTHVEPVIPAYQAEAELRQVSGLGLRLLAEKEALAALQDPALHGRPIVIYGSLHVQAGTLNVRSVRAAKGSPGNTPSQQ